MDKKELSQKIADALRVYVEDPAKRCANPAGGCFYDKDMVAHDTPGCLVGAMIPHELASLLDTGINPAGPIDMILRSLRRWKAENNYPRELDLMPDFIINNGRLFSKLQTLHDVPSNWTREGISVHGREALSEIIDDFELDREPFMDLLTTKEV